jgi:uncharacterized protein
MPRAMLTLTVLPESYAICRLEPKTAAPPSWATRGPFWSAIRTSEEFSIVCAEQEVPLAVTREGGWRILKCEGPLDFALTGIISSIAEPLADAGVPIFPLATYDTDYVLVKDSQLDVAKQALSVYGHNVNG